MRQQETVDITALYGELSGAQRETLRALIPLAKKKAEGEEIARLERERGQIGAALRSPDAKARKNAAMLLSELGGERTAELIAALDAEETEFVRPSMILAVGRTRTAEAKEYLLAYCPRNTVEKHREEEEEALRLARCTFAEPAPAIIPEIAWQKVALMAVRDHADLLEEELLSEGLEYTAHEALSDCFVISAEKWSELARLRCYTQAMVILGRCPANPVSLSNYLKKGIFAKKLTEIFGEGRLSYRLEIGGDKLPAEELEALFSAALSSIDQPTLVNNPSSYSLELRLMVKKDVIYVFALPKPATDQRFSYRKNALSASINPVTAATMMRYAYPYLKRDAEVIDPFCGTGTMLFEREKVKPAGSLTGGDISMEAVEFARENGKLAHSKARFLHADIRKFVPKQRYDECISNMPFGHRVSSHEANRALYAAFVKKLTEILKPGGMAFLYTNDKQLMREQAEREETLTLVDEARFISGNIHASLFILRYDGK